MARPKRQFPPQTGAEAVAILYKNCGLQLPEKGDVVDTLDALIEATHYTGVVAAMDCETLNQKILAAARCTGLSGELGPITD